MIGLLRGDCRRLSARARGMSFLPAHMGAAPARPLLGLPRRGRVRQVLAQGVREDGRDLFGRLAAVLGDGAHGRRVVEERHHARHHQEELPVDVLRGVGRQVDDPGRDVLGAEVAEREAALPGAGREAALGAHRARRLGDGRGHAGHRAGADGVHRDAVAADVARGDAREPRDAVLGRAVVRLPRVAVDARGGRDRDDPPAPLLAHAAGGVPGAVEGALQVDGDDRVPLLLAHVEDHPVAQDAGVVHQDVDRAELLDRRLDDALGGREVGDAVGVGDRPPAAGADRLHHFVGDAPRGAAAVDLGAEVVDDHRGPLGREQLGDGAADAAPRARDDRRLALEPLRHGSGLLGRRRVREALEDRPRRQALELVERPVPVRLVERPHRPRLRDERHLASEAEEELPVDAAGVLARQVDDHGGHVVGVELLDLGDAAVLALDALLPPELARAPHLLVDRHARAGDGADGVHGDAVLPEVARRHLGEPADRRLGRAVVRLPRVAEQARARAEGDDPPVAPLAHVRAGVAHAVEGALKVHRDDRVPLLLAHVEDHAVAQDAGAGDERVEAAPGLERRADEARGAVPGGDRVGVGHGLAAGTSDLLHHVEGGTARRHAAVERDAVVVHDHPRALGGEAEGDTAPDAAARAGHYRDAAGEHVRHPWMLHRARASGRGVRSSGSLPPPMLLSEHDRPTALHYRILALTWAGWLFDFYDLILYTFLLDPISRELGRALFGYLADRHGRRAVLQWSILTYSAGTVLCGLAPGVATLLAARLVTGLGVGGEWAIGHALLGESVPARLRGRFGALLQTGAPVGVGLAALVGSFVAPRIGWRATFILSGLPALLVTAIRRTLPESELWLARRRAAPPVGELLAPGLRRLVAVAFGLAVLNMSSYWFTYTWLPTYLTEERGLSIAASGWKILVVVLGELLGYASFGWVSDRFGRKPAFSLYATLMAAGLVSITLLWPVIVGWPPLLLLCLGLVGFGTGTW